MSAIWLVESEQYDYDEYDGFVVRADSGERALEMTKKSFTPYQLKKGMTVRLVTPDGAEETILGSFNAG